MKKDNHLPEGKQPGSFECLWVAVRALIRGPNPDISGQFQWPHGLLVHAHGPNSQEWMGEEVQANPVPPPECGSLPSSKRWLWGSHVTERTAFNFGIFGLKRSLSSPKGGAASKGRKTRLARPLSVSFFWSYYFSILINFSLNIWAEANVWLLSTSDLPNSWWFRGAFPS